MSDVPWEIEERGYTAGHNPYWGEWKKTYNFPPVSYSNKSAERKQDFRNKVRAELNNKFVFCREVQLTITLYLNHEKVLETPEYGDLDNYAKSICDALKGNGGIMIDDCQIQSLHISWIDVAGEAHFEISLKSAPDDFIPARLKLYEMPDKLYYPMSDSVWEDGDILKLEPEHIYPILTVLSAITAQKKNVRHRLRLEGMASNDAFNFSRYMSPSIWAFHRTRIENSGYGIVSRKEWRASFQKWSEMDGNAGKAKEIEELLATVNFKKTRAST